MPLEGRNSGGYADATRGHVGVAVDAHRNRGESSWRSPGSDFGRAIGHHFGKRDSCGAWSEVSRHAHSWLHRDGDVSIVGREDLCYGALQDSARNQDLFHGHGVWNVDYRREGSRARGEHLGCGTGRMLYRLGRDRFGF